MIPVLAVNHRRFTLWMRTQPTATKSKLAYVSSPEALLGREPGSPVLIVGDLADRPDFAVLMDVITARAFVVIRVGDQ